MMGNNNVTYNARNNHNNNHGSPMPKRGEIPPGPLLPSHHPSFNAIPYPALKTIRKKKMRKKLKLHLKPYVQKVYESLESC